MSKLLEIHRRLNAVHDESIDASMAAALPTADPAAAKLIAKHLLENDHPNAALSLVQNFHLLPGEIQTSIVTRASAYYHALRQAAQKRSGPGPINAIQIVRRARSPRLAHLLVDQLRFGDAEVRSLAAESLLEMARELAASATHDAEAEQIFITGLEEALNLYRHHGQPMVLLAVAALIPRPMAGIFRILQDRTHPAAEPMARLMEGHSAPEFRRSLLVWLRMPPLMDPAVQRLHRMDGMVLAEPLRFTHFLSIGTATRGLRRLSDARRLCPSAEITDGFPASIRRTVPRWIRALPLDPPNQIDALSKLIHSHDVAMKISLFRALLSISEQPGGEGAHDVLSTFTDDADPQLARMALRHLVRVRWPGLAKLLIKLVNSPHAEIRQLAGGHLAPLGFTRFWDSWPRLSFAQQIAGGQALIKLDATFHKHLAERLARPERAARLRALAIIHTLNQGPWFESSLQTLSHDLDEVIVSAVARAMGTCDTPVTVEALERLLHHPDSRVRANAIESLHQLKSTRHVDRLLDMAEREENRPRANAIHALMEMRTGEALTSLARMLAHPQPAQRTSALWLIDHLGLIDLSRHVAEMSITDRDDKVKRRAGEVIQHLITVLRADTHHHDHNQGAA